MLFAPATSFVSRSARARGGSVPGASGRGFSEVPSEKSARRDVDRGVGIPLERSGYPLRGRDTPCGVVGIVGGGREGQRKQRRDGAGLRPRGGPPQHGRGAGHARASPPIGRPHNGQVCPRGRTNRPAVPYSPECLEGRFSELRAEGVLRSPRLLATPKQPQRSLIWGMAPRLVSFHTFSGS